MTVIPSIDNLHTTFWLLSVKYFLYPLTANDSGSVLIPYSPAYATFCPITKLRLVTLALPSAEYIASLSINDLLTLLSWNIIKFVSSAYSFCIEPLAGSIVLVISSATENWLVWLVPVLELNIPECIKELNLFDCFFY